MKFIVCTNELKEMKEIADDVIQAVKRAKRSNMEDLVSMKSVLKEFHLALGTFFEQVYGKYTVGKIISSKEKSSFG